MTKILMYVAPGFTLYGSQVSLENFGVMSSGPNFINISFLTACFLLMALSSLNL